MASPAEDRPEIGLGLSGTIHEEAHLGQPIYMDWMTRENELQHRK